MNAADIMTVQVVTVSPETPVHDLAVLLVEQKVSAVPVIESDRLAGIVSEADLLHRYEIGTDCALRREPRWLRLFAADRSSEEYVKSHARRVRDIMTADVATVAPDTPLSEVAALLEKRSIKRVPVVQDGRLVGIVSRSDLVWALAKRPVLTSGPLSDEIICGQLFAELRRQPWWRSDYSSVTVENGTVTYAGLLEFENDRTAARVAAETIPGVRGVVDRRMAYRDLPVTI
jgi:CBS domain-containing protein